MIVRVHFYSCLILCRGGMLLQCFESETSDLGADYNKAFHHVNMETVNTQKRKTPCMFVKTETRLRC